MTALEVEIVSAEELRDGDWALWRAWADADPNLSSPYFRPEFTRTASRISPDSAVAVFLRGGHVVGFFPHQRRGGALQPIAAPMNDYHAVIAAPGETISLEDVARLLNPRRLNVNAWVGPAAAGVDRHTVQVVMPDGFDAWYAERRATHGKFFKDKERARRSMETELGPLRATHGIVDTAMLDELIGLKQAQYRRSNRHDVFACGWTRDLLHAFMDHPTHDGFGGCLTALWAGDHRVAMEFSLFGGDTYHFWFPAYEPRFARCSPGILLSMETMRAVSPRGVTVFDYGFEGEHYKKYFCNGRRALREAVILRPGLGAGLSEAAVGVLNVAARGRGDALRTSVRRRWAAIEACETTPINRMKGAAQAVHAAAAKLARPHA